MLKLSVAIAIRERFRHGESLSQISRDLGIDRKTTRKYAYMKIFPPVAKRKAPRRSILDPYKAMVDEWLTEDNHLASREQRTAVQIWKKLTDEYDYQGSYPTVQKYVKYRRKALAEKAAAGKDAIDGRKTPER